MYLCRLPQILFDKFRTMRLMQNNYTYLLMDLDGTVTDPMEGITRAVQYALASLGIEVQDRRLLCPFIGPPLKVSFQEFYHLDEAETAQAISKYREYFSAQGIFENQIYEGMKAFLQTQQAAGKQLILATSKPEPFALRILDYFQITPYFTFVGGSSLDHTRTEKEEVIRYILDSLPISDLSSAIMIGDRKFDIEGAHLNGLRAIGVLYGYGSREELEQAGADYLAADLTELSRLV